jgi:fermentation-respiration switch protein FrsA (DUF1100 family)
MLRLLSGLVLAALLAYAAVLAALYLGQRRLLFPVRVERASAAEAGLAGFEDVVLETPDGERLVGWWRPPQPGKALIVYFHGNGSSLFGRRERARALTASGRGLLFVSYRGYSGSTGAPSEEGLRIDAHTIYGWITKSYDPRRLVLYGESLGSGVAVRLAAERPVGGLILDAPFTSAEDVAALRYPFAPVRWLMRDPFRSADVVRDVKAPILVIHGDADPVVPFRLGEALFAAAPEPKRFVRLPGIGHSSTLESGGLREVDAFLGTVEASLPMPAGGPPAQRPGELR